MRVFVAGATGTIAASLVEKLLMSGHEVIGLRRRAGGQAEVRWVTADVLDRDGLLHAVSGMRADAVVSELSALKTPPARHRDMAATNILRTRGTANLLEVAHQIGARRFVTQSMMFGYGYDDQGPRLRRESEPFAPEHQGREAHLAAMRENERMVLTDHSVAGVALRYALFYGAGASQPLVDGVAHRKLPVLASASPLSWIHVDDAASATVAALERGEAGQAYNIADDQPVSWTVFIDHLARTRRPHSAQAAVLAAQVVSPLCPRRPTGWRLPRQRQGKAATALAAGNTDLSAWPRSTHLRSNTRGSSEAA